MAEETGKIDIEDIQKLNIQKLIGAVANELKVHRAIPTPINIYDLCGVRHYETTHSAILAGLLGYNGGRVALQSFIKIFSSIQLPDKELESVSIETERCINTNGQQRRLDILIRVSNRLLIIIENKIFTDDHDQQLQAYYDWLDGQIADEKCLVYLTLDGRKSVEDFPDDKYKCLSYKDNIIQWLKECVAFTQFDMRYHCAIFQYLEFWETWFMEKNELNEKIIPLIIASKASYDSARQISETFGEARKHLITKTLQEWQEQKCIKEQGYELVSKAEEMGDGKDDQSILFKWNDNWFFGFDFGGDFSNVSYGVACANEPSKTENFVVEGWQHTDWWPAYKYMEDSDVRYLGSNAHLCIEPKDKKHVFDVLNAAFKEMVEMLQQNETLFGKQA